MPITTWLDEHEQKGYSTVADRDLNELLQEIHAVFPGQYFLQQHYYNIPGRFFFMPATPVVLYTLYSKIKGIDVQVINFGGLGSPANAQVISAFFYGVLAGKRLTLQNPHADLDKQ